MWFFGKLLHSTRFWPHVIITDKLRSYGTAKKVVLPRVAHRRAATSITERRTRMIRPSNGSAG